MVKKLVTEVMFSRQEKQMIEKNYQATIQHLTNNLVEQQNYLK